MNNDYESALRNSFFHNGVLVYNGNYIRTDYSYHDCVITVQEAGIQPIALDSILEVRVDEFDTGLYNFHLLGIFYIDNQMVNELEIRQYDRHNNTVLWKLLKNKIG